MSYQAFAAQDEHREALEQLWAESMNDRRIASVRDRRWTWLYQGNPAGPALTYAVKHVESDRIVGSASVFPREVLVEGQLCKAGVLADFVMSKRHRVAGPALMVQRSIVSTHRERGFDFLFGYPNKGAAPLFTRLRFKVVGDSTLWVKPLRTAKKLAVFLNPIAAHLIAPFANAALATRDAQLALSRPNHYRVTLDRRPDAAFDDLWEREKLNAPLSCARSADYLNWRYINHTTERYHVFTWQSRDRTRVHGYVIYYLHDNHVFVADLFAEHGRTEALLLSFCRRMRRQGHDSVCVNYAGDPSFVATLRTLHFFKRPGVRRFIAFVGPDQPKTFRETVYNELSWSLHDGELDI